MGEVAFIRVVSKCILFLVQLHFGKVPEGGGVTLRAEIMTFPVSQKSFFNVFKPLYIKQKS